MSKAQVRYDPFDAEISDDPYPTYRLLRDEAPVYRAEESNTWVLSRHRDITAALLDHDSYCSVNGVIPTPPGVTFDQLLVPPMMIAMDPPRHDKLRALVSKAFTPRRIAALNDGIEDLVSELCQQLDRSGGAADFAADFASIIPAVVIADLLGIPRSDRKQFRQWATTLVEVNPILYPEGLATAAEVYAYFADFLAERRRKPREDLISALVQAEIDDTKLTDDELLGFCFMLLLAGYETTANLLSNAAVVLADHPDSRHRICADPTLLGPAIEELLRYDSSVQALARTLSREVRLHGVTMSQGDSVLLLFGSANRDERVFADPDVFDIDRKPEHQVAFGRGVHFCLGAGLARMEARIALRAFLARVPDWEVDSASAVRLRSCNIRGYRSLPITWATRPC